MNKLKGTIWFVIALIAVAGACLLAAFGIGKDNKGAAKNIILGLDLKGGVSITYEVVGDTPSSEVFSDTINKLKKRVMAFSTESDVYSQGDNRITVDIPGQDDAQAVLDKLGKPGTIEFTTNYGTDKEKVWITGSDISEAQPAINTNSGNEYVVELTFTDAGTATFTQVTTEFVGKELTIVYDGEKLKSPTINTVISNGQAEITGLASWEEAEELASMIRIGSLEVELNDISSQVVGAKLGQDALSTSLKAGLIGFILIVLFMIIAYRVSGLAASFALTFYIALMLLTLNAFDSTLTLPGIAGIILSIGMAVDANVIVFARIKEEIATGASVDVAIKTGFKKATSAIVDGNITTLIAAIVLWWKGSGTVQGFAQTLAFGIVLSMFTSMVASRVFVRLLYAIGLKDAKYYGAQKERKTINFLKHKLIFFAISGVCIVAGIVMMVVDNSGSVEGKDSILNYSVEFKGGLQTSVEFEEAVSVDKFNDNIKSKIADIIGDNDVVGNDVIGSNKFTIKTQELDEETKTAMRDMLVKDFGAIEDSFEEISVSATVSDEMKSDAIIAVVIAIICMLIYIFIRFKDFKFATSAIIALVHDVMIVLTFYVISWTTVGNTFIACMLTIVGYSINATIVIFDRIRENLKTTNHKEELANVVNKSITQTLTRSIYTSLTTFITVFILYILGVTAIKEFTLPLMVGIIAGAYSSVCITGALWYTMAKRKYNKKLNLKK